jgi:uncharacterized protein YceK
MKNTIIIAVTAVLMSGCSTLSTVGIAAQHTVSRYCEAGADARNVIRTTVSDSVTPNLISVTCATDAVAE